MQIVTTLPRSVAHNNRVVCIGIDEQIDKRKAYLRQKINKHTTVVLNHYAIAKEICDPKRSIGEQNKCKETWNKIESMMLVLNEMEKELKLLDK